MPRNQNPPVLRTSSFENGGLRFPPFFKGGLGWILNFSYKSLFIILFFLLIGIVTLFKFYPQNKISAAWWNDGWGYRKAINIGNTGATQTNIQIKLLDNYDLSALVTAGKLQSDLDDLRFTDVNGKLIDYWIEDSTNNSVDVWGIISSLPTSGASVYMYYGNPSVNAASTTTNMTIGGTMTSVAGYRIHTFKGNGTLTNGKADNAEVLVVAGGGGGGTSVTSSGGGGGGGGGGLTYNASYALTQGQIVSVTVGVGGSAGATNGNQSGSNGSDSTFGTITTTGGGGGARVGVNGNSGGSGGGGGYNGYTTIRYGGSGVVGIGNSGGNTSNLSYAGGAGGGGAAGIGGDNKVSHVGGDAGLGINYSITGVGVTYAGGGRGGGGAPGAISSPANTGKGGDGSYAAAAAASGADGIVVVRYSSATASSPAAEEQSTAPIAYWKFDEGVGTTAYDSSSSAINGLISAATWITDDQCISGKCLYFNESTSNVNLGTNNVFTKNITDITISAWVKLGKDLGTVSDNYEVISNESYQNYGYLFRVENTTSTTTAGKIHFRFSQAGASTNVTAQSNSFPNDHQWHYLTATKNGTVGKIYLDGKEMTLSTNQSLSNPVDAAGATKIGGIGQLWNGFLDEVKVYPYARTAAQIKLDYSSGKSHSSSTKGTSANLGSSNKNISALSDGLVGYWKMDESTWTGGAGGVIDSSGNNVNGTAAGATLPTVSSGKFGNAGTFTGIAQYVDLASIPVDTSTSGAKTTVSFWMNWNGSAGSMPFGFTSYDLYFYDSTHFGFNTGCSDGYGTSSVGWTNTWVYVSAIYVNGSPSQNEIYINGTKQTLSLSGSQCSRNVTSTARIATWPNSTGYNFNGKIDDLRIYNRALSPSEIQQLYMWAPSPVGYWDFNENSGTIVNDKSGLGNTGILAGNAAWTSGKYGGAINLDGNGDWVNIGAAPTYNIAGGNFSLCSWFKTSGTEEDIVSNGVSANGNYLLMTYLGKLRGHVWYSGNANTIDSITTVNDNIWHYGCQVVNDTQILLYIDGKLDNKATLAGTKLGLTGTTIIGSRTASGTSSNFIGKIDDVKIYNYARNQRQIIEDMNAGHPIGGSPVGSQLAYWKFDEGYGSTTYDSSSQNNNAVFGTGNSAPTWSTSGKFGKALSFNGTNNYIMSTTQPDFPTQISFSGWVNPSSAASTSYIFNPIGGHLGGGSVPNNQMYLYMNTNRTLSANIWTVTPGSQWETLITTATAIPLNQWSYAAYTFDGSKQKIYINGILAAQSSVGTTGTEMSDTGSQRIYALGANGENDAFNSGFIGLIDEVKIYNTALTAEDIKLDYNRGSAIVMGNLGTNSSGVSDSSSNRSYCIPGDTSTCNPPVGEWKFEEGVGTTAYDTSGNNNSGVWQGTLGNQWSQGKIGKAGNFNGINNYTLGTNNLGISGNAEFTMCAWIKYTGASLPSNYPSFMGNNSTGTTNQGMSFTFYQGRPALDFWSNRWRATNALSLNTWYYICGTKTAGTISTTSKIYVNGQLVPGAVEGTDTSPNITDSPPVTGRLDGTRWFQGLVDQVNYYDYARTPAQIAWDYNRGGPVGWWKLDECQGNTVYDSSGVGTTGSISIGTSGTQNSLGTCAVGTSAAWTAGASGKINSSLNFDGIDDYINLGNNTNLNPQQHGWSTSFWVKSTQKTSQNGGYIRVMGRISGGAPYWILRTHTNNGDYAVMQMLDAGSNSGGVSGTNTVTDGAWHHLVFVYDYNNSKSYIYRDGIRDGYNDWTGTSMGTVNPSLPLHIGQANHSTEFFSGQIDDVRIYNYALTATQIKDVYNNGAISFN